MKVPISRSLTTLALATAASCATQTHPAARLGPQLSSIPDGPPNAVAESIWTAALQWYSGRSEPTEGDITRRTDAVVNGGRGGAAPTVLLLRMGPTPPPYSRQWLGELLRAGLLQGVCGAARPQDCQDQEVVTYLTLGDPVVGGDSASVPVHERALNPATCRQGAFGGEQSTTLRLRRGQAGWRVLGRGVTMASTVIGC